MGVEPTQHQKDIILLMEQEKISLEEAVEKAIKGDSEEHHEHYREGAEELKSYLGERKG